MRFISLLLHQPTDSRQLLASFMPPLPRLQPALPIQSHFPVQLTSSTCFLPAKSTQSCPTLCDPIDGSPPGSPVPGLLQARALEWVPLPPLPPCSGPTMPITCQEVGRVENHPKLMNHGLPRRFSDKESTHQCRRPWLDPWAQQIH